ncbi:diguanylate cyclase/phosphodiesterase [Ciceribacter lividus]|uniref:Diguanylate cyclase/phosphodiesterase n=1 Tax=Ciceribacter lividus TaxID=1197950 RepID=A0A6I7HSI7_9HYPH|nr:EAL domain-containing protein [Ciceribacter lividus]RCW28704.1 diguanylate cyclase/phosphodiesterase [Ciceribacter lividus]
MDTHNGSRKEQHQAELVRFQADLIMSSHTSTLLFNGFITLSTAGITVLNHGTSLGVIIWAAIVLLTLAFRYASAAGCIRSGMIERRPGDVLTLLSFGAFVSGLAWAALPFSVEGFDGSGRDAALFLIMVGTASGAIIKGLGYSQLAMAFATPLLLSMLVSLVLSGNSASLVLAANAAALTTVLYRHSLSAEQVFSSNELAKLQATDLALSLSEAHGDILRKNGRLEVLANCDPVTGLANRTHFNGRLGGDVARAVAVDEPVALLLLDLDRFKSINDSFGHSAGDAVLLEVGKRLRRVVGDDGLVARLGGDEFGIILTGSNARRRALSYAQQLQDASQEPVPVGGTSSVIGLSIGLACFPAQASSAEELMAFADMALYEAKDHGRRRIREFDPALKARIERQHAVEQDLADAIRNGAVEAWFQPQVRLDNGAVTGFEALLRWTHPRLGPISPPEVVQAAHSQHLAEALSEHVATAACDLLTRLPALGLPEATVALNISPREFSLYCIADMLGRVAGPRGINPALLEIEITEEATLDTEGAGEQLKRLENAGYKLAVDDFGMGHSSLAYLIDLKVDRLKIDRSFVKGVAGSRTNQSLIAALVGLGHALALDIVVEGVETAEDAEVLALLGCRVAQGYHFARPMPCAALVGWLGADRPAALEDGRAVA